jgi:hypothetical protein
VRLCGEEIMNEHEVARDGLVLGRACAGESYYDVVAGFALLALEGAIAG